MTTIRLHSRRYEAMVDNAKVPLSPGEWNVLSALVRNNGGPVSDQQLLIAMSKSATVESLQNYIHFLRYKLGDNAIERVRGYGYRLGLNGFEFEYYE